MQNVALFSLQRSRPQDSTKVHLQLMCCITLWRHISNQTHWISGSVNIGLHCVAVLHGTATQWNKMQCIWWERTVIVVVYFSSVLFPIVGRWYIGIVCTECRVVSLNHRQQLRPQTMLMPPSKLSETYCCLLFWPIGSIMWKSDNIHRTGST